MSFCKSVTIERHILIILYADDILIIAPPFYYRSRTDAIHCCERELHWLDVAINFKKSCCLRIDIAVILWCQNC